MRLSPSRIIGSGLLTATLLAAGVTSALAADVSLAVSGPSTVDRNQTYTYSVTVRNNENTNFSDFNVVYNINGAGGILANTTYQGASRTCTTSNGSVVTCSGFSLSPYQEQTFTFTVKVNDSATCGSTVDFMASVVYPNLNQASRWSNSTRATVNCGSTSSTSSTSNGSVDMSITQNGPTTLNRGNSSRYTFTVYNSGNVTAQNVVVSSPIPSGMSFLPSNSSAGCSQNGSSVYCTVGSVGAISSKSVDIVFDMPSTYSCNTSFVNRGYVSTSSGDTNSSNDSTALTTYVSCGSTNNNQSGCIEVNSSVFDLSGRQIANPGFTISLSNGARVTTDRNGYARYSDVPVGSYTLSAAVPSNYYLDSVSPSGGQVYVDSSGCEQVYFRFVSRTNNPYANQAQCNDGIDNDGDRRYDYPGDPGCSSAYDNSEYDNGTTYNNSSNNYRPTTTYYNTDPYVAQLQNYVDGRRGGVSLNTRVDRLEVLPNGAVAYTITVTNNGSANLRDVEIEDRFDNRMRVISLTQGGAVGGGRVIWNIGSVPAHGSRSVRVRLQLDGSVRQGEILSNSATARGSFGTLTSSASVRVVSSMPETGFDLNSLFGSSAPVMALPLAAAMALGLAGAATGGVFGRRFI